MEKRITGLLLAGLLTGSAVLAAPAKPKKKAVAPAKKPAPAPAKTPAPAPTPAGTPAANPQAAPTANAPIPARASTPEEIKAAQLAAKAADLQNQAKWTDAAPLLQQAAELTPNDWVMWDRAGWGWIDAEQPQKALAAFQTARKVAPADTPVGGLLAAHYFLGQGMELQALLAANSAGTLEPPMQALITAGVAAKKGTPAWSLGLGTLYARVIRNNFRALNPLEAAAQAQSGKAEVWLLLADVNQALNRGQQEDAAAIKYLELAPDTVDAYRMRAERYSLQQQVDEARDEYAAGISKYPLAGDLYFALARIYEKLKQTKSADAMYRKLITAATTANRPDLVWLGRAQLAGFQARQRDYAGAETFYREAAAKPGATTATWTTWGSLLAIQGKWDEAARALLSAVDRDEKLRGTSQASVRPELLTERYRAAVCRLLAEGKGPCSSSLRAALALREENHTATEMEARAFLAWCDNTPLQSTELVYRKGDERWAAFTWRRQVVGDEFDARTAGTGSISAIGWRAILQQVQKQFPDCWPAAYSLSRIYAAAGYGDPAVDLLTGVARARTDWWAPYYALGQLYVYRQDREKGIPILQRVVQLAPECRQARLNLQLLSGVKEEEDQ